MAVPVNQSVPIYMKNNFSLKGVGAPVENPKSEKLGSMIEDISSVPLYILSFWIRFWGGYTVTLPHSS